MAPESTHITDHRHFFPGNLTLKGSTAIHKENTSFLSTTTKKSTLV